MQSVSRLTTSHFASILSRTFNGSIDSSSTEGPRRAADLIEDEAEIRET